MTGERDGDGALPVPSVTVTVVIPALNASASLAAQLEALDRQRDAPPFEVVVVDNASTDGTAALAAGFPAQHFSIRVVPEMTRGINAARNAGIAAAADGVVLLCDADDEVWPDWVGAMVAALKPATWVGGRLDYTRLNSERTRTIWGAPERSTYRTTQPFADNTYGCNCGFWRVMWESSGMFDPAISGTGGDETEFFMRAWDAGFSRIDVPEAVVSYRLRPGVRAAMRQRFRQGRNQVLLRTLPGGRLLPGALTRSGTWRALGYRGLAAPKYLWSSKARYAWASSVAVHAGRLSGFRRTTARAGVSGTHAALAGGSHTGLALAIVIPVRDRPELLRRAVDSVVVQRRPGVELVVIDDGSAPPVDPSLLPAGVGRVLRVNGVGVSSARNAGVAAVADAAWVTFLDSDDEAAAGWIDAILDALASGAALFSCGARYDWDDGSEEMRMPLPMWSGRGAVRARFLAGTFALDRSLFLRAGGYRPGLRHGENSDLGWRVAAILRRERLPSVALDEPLVHVHAVRRERSASERLESALAVLDDPPEMLVANRRTHASYYAIAGVAASTLGERRRAVRLLGRAVRTNPLDARHVARLARSLVRGAPR